MPLFSIFTPFGALAFSSAPSRIQQIYESTIANLNSQPGQNFDTSPGTNIESMIYARARVQAMARYVVERAYNNANPRKAQDSLATLEKEFGLTPGPNDGEFTRRAALAARFLLPGGAIYSNVTNALATLLGSGFLAYRVMRPSEVVMYPSTGGDQPANFQAPRTVIKNFRLTQSISRLMGSPQTVTYAPFDAATPHLLNGEKLVVDPETRGLTETVTVSGVTASTFVGTFHKGHSSGRILTTQPYPFWTSTQRHVLVIVTRAVAESPEKRRQIHELMARIMRGVTTWDIVPDDGTMTGHTAPFTIGDTVLGRVGYAAIQSFDYS